jgi:hypothetical protein
VSPVEHPLSPDLDIGQFCRAVSDLKHPFDVMDAAGAESSRLQRAYRERSGRAVRGGSKLGRYIDNLQQVIVLMMNGTFLDSWDDEFYFDVAPVVLKFLPLWTNELLQEQFAPGAVETRLARAAERDTLLRVLLDARDAGRTAAERLHRQWVKTLGPREQYSYHATAVMHLSIRPNSARASELFAVAVKYPFLLRVERGFSSGLVLLLWGMTNSFEQGLNVAAEEAALSVIKERLGVDGYVTSHES